MEPEIPKELRRNSFNQVTPLSKYLALFIFIAMPFVGGWVGYNYAPAKIILDSTVETSTDKSEVVNDQSHALTTKNDQATPVEQSNLTTNISPRYAFSLNLNEDFGPPSKDVRGLLQYVNAGYIKEMNFKPFSYQGIRGEVVHYCAMNSLILSSPFNKDTDQELACLGENYLVVEWDNNIKIISYKDTPNKGDLFNLKEVFFNEGKFETVTESNSKEAKLLVVVDELECFNVYRDMCMTDLSLTDIIELPSLTVKPVTISSVGDYGGKSKSIIDRLIISKDLYWNRVGTKAVYMTACFGGCPSEVLEGFSLDGQTVVPLLREPNDHQIERRIFRDEKSNLNWVSDDSVVFGTTTFSF